MSNLHFRIELGDDIGRVEVDVFGNGLVYLETVDTSYFDGTESKGLVVLKPKQARKIAKALRKAAGL